METVAAVDSIIESCPDCGVEEVVMGMAHRGRLNILTSVMRKNFDVLFEQFSENYVPDAVGGFMRRERTAKLLYIRSQYEHMSIVTSGKANLNVSIASESANRSRLLLTPWKC